MSTSVTDDGPSPLKAFVIVGIVLNTITYIALVTTTMILFSVFLNAGSRFRFSDITAGLMYVEFPLHNPDSSFLSKVLFLNMIVFLALIFTILNMMHKLDLVKKYVRSLKQNRFFTLLVLEWLILYVPSLLYFIGAIRDSGSYVTLIGLEAYHNTGNYYSLPFYSLDLYPSWLYLHPTLIILALVVERLSLIPRTIKRMRLTGTVKTLVNNGYHNYDELAEMTSTTEDEVKEIVKNMIIAGQLRGKLGATQFIPSGQESTQKVSQQEVAVQRSSFIESRKEELSERFRKLVKRAGKMSVEDFMLVMDIEDKKLLYQWLLTLPEDNIRLVGDTIVFNNVEENLMDDIDQLMSQFAEMENKKVGKI